jgi:hypothetical protein
MCYLFRTLIKIKYFVISAKELETSRQKARAFGGLSQDQTFRQAIQVCSLHKCCAKIFHTYKLQDASKG